jgi:hypothetical protein
MAERESQEYTPKAYKFRVRFLLLAPIFRWKMRPNGETAALPLPERLFRAGPSS